MTAACAASQPSALSTFAVCDDELLCSSVCACSSECATSHVHSSSSHMLPCELQHGGLPASASLCRAGDRIALCLEAGPEHVRMSLEDPTTALLYIQRRCHSALAARWPALQFASFSETHLPDQDITLKVQLPCAVQQWNGSKAFNRSCASERPTACGAELRQQRSQCADLGAATSRPGDVSMHCGRLSGGEGARQHLHKPSAGAPTGSGDVSSEATQHERRDACSGAADLELELANGQAVYWEVPRYSNGFHVATWNKCGPRDAAEGEGEC
jgi:hypothetical protein